MIGSRRVENQRERVGHGCGLDESGGRQHRNLGGLQTVLSAGASEEFGGDPVGQVERVVVGEST
jgi:hypothetical protein